jgi:hypothetical protein
MMTGQTFYDVVEKTGHDGSKDGYRWKEIIQYLLDYGLVLGMSFGGPDEQPVEIYNSTTHITAEVPLAVIRALVTVRSFYQEGETHALYWDGSRLHDPWPGAGNLDWADYEVIKITPVTEIFKEVL